MMKDPEEQVRPRDVFSRSGAWLIQTVFSILCGPTTPSRVPFSPKKWVVTKLCVFQIHGLTHDTCHEMEMDWLAPFGQFQMGAGCIGETGTQGGGLERGCAG